MIDLRCHLLDGPPCGPATFAEAVALGRQLGAAGLKTVVATPLWPAASLTPPLPLGECRQRLARLQTALGAALSLRLGFVLPFSPQLPALAAEYGVQLTLGGGRYLLVALPALAVPAACEEVWGALQQQGYSVIIAQPECNPALRRDTDRLARWVALGLKLQLNAASLAGTHGREVQRYALDWASRYETCTLVTAGVKGTGAALDQFAPARAALQRKLGARAVQRLLQETPAALIAAAAGLEAKLPATPAQRLTTLLRTLKPGKSYDSAA